jgi:hypothetical protein
MGPPDCYCAIPLLDSNVGSTTRQGIDAREEKPKPCAPPAIAIRTPPVSVGALRPQATLSYQMRAWAVPGVTSRPSGARLPNNSFYGFRSNPGSPLVALIRISPAIDDPQAPNHFDRAFHARSFHKLKYLVGLLIESDRSAPRHFLDRRGSPGTGYPCLDSGNERWAFKSERQIDTRRGVRWLIALLWSPHNIVCADLALG